MKFLSDILVKAGLVVENTFSANAATNTIYAGTGTRLRTEANNLVFERVSSSGTMKMVFAQGTLSPTAKAYIGYSNATLNLILANEYATAGLELRTSDIIRQQIFANGNIVIGSSSPTDAGYKLDVLGLVRTQEIRTGAHSFRDQMYISHTSDGWTKQNAYNATGAHALTFVGDLRFASVASVKAVFAFNGTYSNNGTIYGGEMSLMKIFTGDAFGQSSPAVPGTNQYGINLMPTLNYTSSTSTFTGFYYNPTLVATTGLTHYAMHLVNGLVRVGDLSGTGTRMVVADSSGVLSTQTITAGITGSGSTGQLAYWNGASSQAGTNNLFWDIANNRLGFNTTNPQRTVHIYNSVADNHLAISGPAPSVSLSDSVTGSTHQAKFGLATASGHYAASATAGDFVIISQTGSTIWMTSNVERLKLSYNGNFIVGGVNDTLLAKLQVIGAIQQSSVTSSVLKVDANGVLVAATAGSDFVAPATLASYVPTSRTITINGVSYDLSADRSWSVASMVYPGAGIAVSTGSSWGTSITDNSSNWNAAYSWGNHASAGYLTASSASSTYLTISNASSTYLTQSSANTIYLNKNDASSIYLSQSSANTIYLNKNDASSIYLSQSSASSIYLSIGNASSTYLSQSSAASIYASLSGSYSNPSWITSLAWSKITGAPAFITGYTETDTLNSVTSRGATTSNTIQVGKLGIGRAAGSNESISVENPEGFWLIQGFRSGSSVGGLHTNSGVLHVQAADVRIQASSTATWNGDTLATRPWVTSQGYITGYTETDTLASVTGRGATTSTAITISGIDSALKVQHDGTSVAWRGRIGSFNASADKSSFLGNYTGRPGVFGHNNALSAWDDLWVNTLGIYGQGNTYLSWFTYVKGNGNDTNYPILHSANYNSYSPTLTGGGASGTWGINITGNANSLGGYTQDFQTVIGTGDYLIIRNQSSSKLSLASWASVQSGLGLGSMAYASTGSYVPYGNWSQSTGMNDSKLYLRTNGDNNHYLWNAADDWEELNAYEGTGFRITSAGGTVGVLYVYGSTNGGYTYSPYSFRAPIFYDSQNTGYYGDFSSTSNMYRLQLGGGAGGTYAGLTVQAVTGNTGPIVAKSLSYATTWSILPWSGGDTYISTGIYYDNGVWTHASDNTKNALFRLSPSGPTWYSSDNSAPSWNIASDVPLWSNVGRWINNVTAPNDVRAPQFRFTNSGNSAYFTGEASWGARIQTDSGYIWFGPANGSYAHIYTDRGQFYFNADILINGTSVVKNDGGTWSISISGNAGSATSAGSVSGLTLTSSANNLNPDNVTQNQLGYNTSVNLFGQTDGGLYSSAYSSNWIHQIYGDFRTGQIAIRGKQSGTWQAWRVVLDSSNYTSYALPLSGGTIATNGFIDFGPNSTWGSTLRVGGNGHGGTTRASVCTTNGNLHLDGGTTGGGGGVYLNAYHNGPIYATTSQHLVLHAGNIASYTAGNVNSISSAVGGSYNWTGINYFVSNRNTTSDSPPLQAYSNNGSGAIMSFHRGGYYAVNFGLDSDNVMRIGGWSAAANRWQLDMSGNMTNAGTITAGGDLSCNTLNTGNVINVGYTRNNESIATTAFRGIEFHNPGNRDYYIGKDAGAWTKPLSVHFYTGIEIRSHQAYGGTRFHNIASGQVGSFNDGDNNFRGYYDIIAYASDRRLKDNVKVIDNAIDKVKQLTGMTYNWNSVGNQYGWAPSNEREAGVFAQDVQAVLPEAVKLAPFDNNMGASKSGENFLTVKYEKIVPLLIEAIKEQQIQIEELKGQLDGITK